MKELFNVNHFIVSQANPHIAPLLRLKQSVRTYGGNFASKIAQLAEMEMKHRCNQILELNCPLGKVAKLFAQDWEGDITIFMPVTLAQLSKAIQNPSIVELQRSINQGRICTWEKLSAIKANCGIELALDECVATLKHRVERAGDVALSPTVKFNGLKRLPSWNVISRQDSFASLEKEEEEGGLMVDPALSPYQGTESVEQSSWTRSGGPLMRSVSSKRLVEFVQNLRIDSRMKREVLG